MKWSDIAAATLLGACTAYAGAVLAATGTSLSGSPALSARGPEGIAVAAPLSNQELALLQAKEASNPALLDRTGAGCVWVTHHGRVVGQNCESPPAAFAWGCIGGGMIGGLFGSFGGVYGAMAGAGAGCALLGAVNYSDYDH